MNYSTGHIYKIICKVDDTFCYIGSTFNSLRNRWQEHKNDYKKQNGRFSIYEYFDKYGIENFKMILIKDYLVCREKQRDYRHLHAYETLWINKSKSCVNKKLPFQPLKKEQQKEYYNKNKDKILENTKEYGSKKVECNICGKCMRRDSITKHKKNQHKTK